MDHDQKKSTKRRSTILVLDDEVVVTQSVAAFLELETEFRVLQFQTPADALAALEVSKADVVISDFLMPEMNGIEFLARVKKMHPDVPRILLTGYADKENSIRAINEIGLYHYMEKPWDNDQLQLVLENAIAKTTLRQNLAERIRELDSALLERNKLAARDVVMRNELLTARRLQESMLPRHLDGGGSIAFSAEYCPALEIGGDFYDVIPLSDTRSAVLIADATGHGIQAALSTAILKFAFSQFTRRDVGPREILIGMNEVLATGLPADTFVAGLVATVDHATGECRLVNAGNPHPFVLNRNERTVKRVAANGLMLGIVEHDVYRPDEAMTIQLQPGEVLFLYTDGISEAENEHGEQFDQSSLTECLVAHANSPVDDLHRQLISASREFSRADHEWDDITLFGIERL